MRRAGRLCGRGVARLGGLRPAAQGPMRSFYSTPTASLPAGFWGREGFFCLSLGGVEKSLLAVSFPGKRAGQAVGRAMGKSVALPATICFCCVQNRPKLSLTERGQISPGWDKAPERGYVGANPQAVGGVTADTTQQGRMAGESSMEGTIPREDARCSVESTLLNAPWRSRMSWQSSRFRIGKAPSRSISEGQRPPLLY